MKLIIEGYQYQEKDVAPILKGFEPFTKDGKVSVNYVGYFFSKEIGDSIFFLPKVLMNEDEDILFHKGLKPTDILDLDTALHNHKIDNRMYDFLSNFSVWIYRAIKEFYRLNRTSEILLYKSFSLLDRSNNKTDATLLDIILSLIRFNNENQDFFMFTIKNIHSGYNKINWNKTISKSSALIQRKAPIYLDPINKKKQINFDEELLIIFFSILAYANEHYGFKATVNYNYELIVGSQFDNYLDGYGKHRLRQIKYKYFSDKALMLWQLCYSFFESTDTIKSSTQDCDYLLARNFNIVFESIIDELIGDDKTKIDPSLKDQPDGKIVDHIFRYASLVNDNDIYYIGDSKYYKIGGSLGGNSVYKQYTYAKNIIQFNINWFFKDKPHLRYRDKLTEGYNITPNFFISAELPKPLEGEYPEYGDAHLKQRENEHDKKQIYQFKNRLFDRDTLWLSHYDINFLFVIALYARSNDFEKQNFKSHAQAEFKQKIQELLNKKYDFYMLEPKDCYNLQRAVDINFRRLYGKIFRPYDDKDILILSLRRDATENDEILEAIRPYFCIYENYTLGSDIDDILNSARTGRTRILEYASQEDFVSLIAAEQQAGYRAVERIFTDSAVNRESILTESQLSETEIPYITPLEKENVLVGYFNSDIHLKAIIDNKLYYTRTGFRNGSLRLDIEPQKCKYLFLHNKQRYLLFRLTGEAPRIFSGAELMRKKFLVHKPDATYIGYDIAEENPTELSNIEIRNAIIKGIGNRSADSYFTTLRELFNL